ncbi:MAG: hypothetical protein LUI60_00350 [Clostridia bacterium]|nr:hypothetical protein [Clostridia bacterium]
MEQLVKSTAAYKILCGEAADGRLAHAYMLHFADGANMRAALKIFAKVIFGCKEGDSLSGRIDRESCPDCKIYPQNDKKFTVDAVSDLISDSALKPTESNIKLYVISGFEECSAIVQNKLLKVLEEPPQGIYFLLGTQSTAPVLPTVISRVHMLEIPPFTAQQIYAALERENAGGAYNKRAAESCGGILGAAQSLAGGAFGEINTAAMELCTADTREKAGALSAKYADSKYKKQIMAEAERLFFTALKGSVTGVADADGKKIAAVWDGRTLLYAAQRYGASQTDLKFNAYFSALLYSVMLDVIQENERWQRL